MSNQAKEFSPSTFQSNFPRIDNINAFFGKISENFDIYFSFLPKECNKTKKGILFSGNE
jgi:hypothetical protein